LSGTNIDAEEFDKANPSKELNRLLTEYPKN